MVIPFIILAVAVVVVGFLILRAYLRMKNLKQTPESQKIKQLTDQTFRQQIKQGLVLVDFWAPWCMPCRLMVPVLNELAEDPENQTIIAKLNVDEARATASQFNIRSIPTAILFKQGKEIQRFVGVKTANYLKQQMVVHNTFSRSR